MSRRVRRGREAGAGERPLKITAEYLARIGGWRVAREGRALFDAGRVLSVAYEPPLLSGVVQSASGGTVEARLRLAEREVDLENLCRCRQAREDGTICAHVLALGYAIVAGGGVAPAAALAVDGPGESPEVKDPARSDTGPVPVRSFWPFQWVVEEDAPEGWPILRLRVILAPAALQRSEGVLQAMLEADDGGVDGRSHWRPLEQFAAQDPRRFAIAEHDERLLVFGESKRRVHISGSLLNVPGEERGPFFAALSGHPEVWVGRERRIQVAPRLRPQLRVRVSENGQLIVKAEEAALPPGKVLAPEWRLGEDDVVRGRSRLPPGYTQSGEVVLSREDIARFLGGELAGVREFADIDPADWLDAFRFRTVTPRIVVELDGTLNALQVKLAAVYPGIQVPLAGLNASGGSRDVLHPDPGDAMGYWRRDIVSENAARNLLVEAGFLPGKRDETGFVLAGEEMTAAFLADRLPVLRREWDVRMAPRLANVMERFVVLRPRLTFRQSADGGWLTGEIGFEPQAGRESELPPDISGFVHGMLQAGRRTRRLGDGRVVIAPFEAARVLQASLGDLDTRQVEAGVYRLRPGDANFLSRTAEAFGGVVKDESGGAQLREAIPMEIPPWFQAELRPYQREGVDWMRRLEANGWNGILADEMGLGKTVQTLAWIAMQKEAGATGGPALVVCPTSLVPNWLAEAQRFAPALKCLRYEGANRAVVRDAFGSCDLVVTSYAMLRSDGVHLAQCQWGLVVLDEAQQIKKPESRTAKAAGALQSPRRLVLTGTPVENSIRDVWSLFHFLMPGYLGRFPDFCERYEARVDTSAMDRLRRRVRPLILRRRKETVAPQLPALIEETAWVDLTPDQRRVYTEVLDTARRQVFEHSGRGGSAAKRRMTVLAALLRLRQASCHLGLLDPLQKMGWKEPSAKFEAVWDRLEEVIEGGHRVLIYSQFTKLLALLRRELDRRGVGYCYLDGATTDRGAVVQRFQGDESIVVFLISLKAGGTGLNLAGADTVFLLDPWWNPAAEAQAIARAHRIGQDRRVVAVRFLARDTVEERVADLQRSKRQVAEQLLDDAGAGGLAVDDLEELLK